MPKGEESAATIKPGLNVAQAKCAHRTDKGTCEDQDHDFGGNPFKPGGHSHCVCCGALTCDEPNFADRNTAYEDDGYCLPCAAADEGLTDIEFAAAMNRRRD